MKSLPLNPLFLFVTTSKTFYNFRVARLQGEIIEMHSFKRKKLLIVNTVSKCGYTIPIEELKKL